MIFLLVYFMWVGFWGFGVKMRFCKKGTQCTMIPRAKIIINFQDQSRVMIQNKNDIEDYGARNQGEKKVEEILQKILEEKEKYIKQFRQKEMGAAERE